MQNQPASTPLTRQAFNMHLFRRPFSVALAFVILLIFTMRVEAALSSNRYLFVVETSKSMQSRTDGVRRVVVDLLGSGMHGQLQAGDTVGLWTFNKELRAGTFPLQDWAPDRRDVLASRVLTFLRAQKWEKSASWSAVMPTLNQVIQNSDLLTVVVISSGDEKISGTLFDDQIKKQFKLWRDQQDKAHMPLLTVFRARKGTLTDCSVTPVPFPVDLPPLPKEYVVVPVPEKPRPPAPAPPPPRKVEPLIVSGHKSTPTTPAPIAPAPMASAPIASEPKPVLTNTVTANTATSTTVAPNTITANFANKVTANPVTSAPDSNAAQIEAAAVSHAEKLVPDFPEPVHSEPATNRAVASSPVKVFAASVPTNSAAPATTTPKSPAPVQAAPAAVPPGSTPVVVPPATASAGSLLPGQKVFARELTPSSPGPSTSVAATEAAISVSAAGGRNGLYWAGCAAAAGLALGLFLVFARRHRAPDQLSLITRSLERERK